MPPQKTLLAPTRRELDTLTLVAKGFSNTRVAEKLNLSQRTVASHIQNLFNKTGCKSRLALVLYFVENGTLPPIGTDNRIARLELQVLELQKERAETIAQLHNVKEQSGELISRVLSKLVR